VDIGVALPTIVPGTSARQCVQWAISAESAGFAGTATLDQIAYPGGDPLITLTAVAMATRRIRLTTTALLAPARGPAAILARQAVTLNLLSGGRFTLGMSVGAREADYAATGVPFRTRGQRMERLIGELRDCWAGQGTDMPAGPVPDLLLAGHSDAAVERAARLAVGWICGGTSRQPYAVHADRARKAWADAGRSAPPRLVALRFFALGASAEAAARATMEAFYAGTGPYVNQAIAGALTGLAAVRAAAAEHRDAGCDELLFVPCSGATDQVAMLAEAVL